MEISRADLQMEKIEDAIRSKVPPRASPLSLEDANRMKVPPSLPLCD